MASEEEFAAHPFEADPAWPLFLARKGYDPDNFPEERREYLQRAYYQETLDPRLFVPAHFRDAVPYPRANQPPSESRNRKPASSTPPPAAPHPTPKQPSILDAEEFAFITFHLSPKNWRQSLWFLLCFYQWMLSGMHIIFQVSGCLPFIDTADLCCMSYKLTAILAGAFYTYTLLFKMKWADFANLKEILVEILSHGEGQFLLLVLCMFIHSEAILLVLPLFLHSTVHMCSHLHRFSFPSPLNRKKLVTTYVLSRAQDILLLSSCFEISFAALLVMSAAVYLESFIALFVFWLFIGARMSMSKEASVAYTDVGKLLDRLFNYKRVPEWLRRIYQKVRGMFALPNIPKDGTYRNAHELFWGNPM
mmetsp:Transcript_47929/g.120636  ORF Transcript_47929/g.120636 Transcript_47929/m.120636 type:complete len:363 (+) Transcript_47929:144-1232(+)